MRFYQIILGSGLSVDQKTLIDRLAQSGAETIQTSHGLFTASSAELKDVQALLDQEAAGVSVSEVNQADEQASLTPDMRSLMQKHS